jgi:hypothetical protein
MDRGMSYDDVRDAWRYYLEHDNKGRGVVFIGHSQGSMLLTALIRQEIDGKPVQSRLVSALLIGTTVPVPRGGDAGGVFQHVPICRSATQTGCVVTYASFRATAPPPPDALFGHVNNPAMAAACANPASLGGGSADLHSYFSVAAAQPWLKTSTPIDTAFVAMTDLISAKCASNANGTYLEITAPGHAPDSRGDHITGDVVIAGAVQPRWGLHLLDMALAMGDMVDLVGRQAQQFGVLRLGR